MTARRKIADLMLIAGVGLGLALAAPLVATGAPVVPVSGTCGTAAFPLTGLKFVTFASISATTSTNFVAVPATGISFVQARAGCVIVAFSAEAYAAPAGGFVQVQALLDNEKLCGPNAVILTSSDVSETRAMNFVCKGVAAGNHTIKMQYRATGAGSTALIGGRTITVHFMP
jgi:hypothetical protein